MTKYIVEGGRPLFGEIQISGAKNAAVAIIPAALMVSGPCRIENMPQISDVTILLNILQDLGARVRYVNSHTVEIDSSALRNGRVPYEAARRCRGSYYMLGALLGRFGLADVALPGGCDFGGARPIDQHLKGFRALGAQVDTQSGFVMAEAAGGRVKGANIFFDKVSVGATINIMLAAAMADGMSVIENAAKEPHVVDVANFLNSMGANIMGAGTDVIKVRGVDCLRGGSYTIIPDQIEAGTYMAAVAACGGEVKLCNIIPKHMDCISAKMAEMGVEIHEVDDSLMVSRIGPLMKANIKTMPYPGFPTDMQPQVAVALCLARGTSIIMDSVWNTRFRYTDQFVRMGAQIQVDGSLAIIEGVERLTGAQLEACDLRAGAAMLIAALAAHGISEITNVQYIERGYEDVIGKIRGVGGRIRAVEVPEEDLMISNVS
ncbi:MAG: UDP-N-acetylglucosamine 1-carboxyvinyltransferase [Oscillibacter sp.]|nr:UDP-N-acetylglucosamine 1-carboxyvinyltransferase [Oscillibacter sp.]